MPGSVLVPVSDVVLVLVLWVPASVEASALLDPEPLVEVASVVPVRRTVLPFSSSLPVSDELGEFPGSESEKQEVKTPTHRTHVLRTPVGTPVRAAGYTWLVPRPLDGVG